MTDVVVSCIRELRSLRKAVKALYKNYREARFMDGFKAITDTSHRNKLLTFQKPPDKPKRDYTTYYRIGLSQLFLSIQSRRDTNIFCFLGIFGPVFPI